jgi:hypothetical protein
MVTNSQHYSEKDLAEFKEIILKKIESANEDLRLLATLFVLVSPFENKQNRRPPETRP